MGLFITFEGAEGSGKSTQARLLYEHLHACGYPVILTREPGGTRIGDLIRRIVLDLQHTEMAPMTETLLFSAARAQLVSEVIRPYLEQGGIVLCDRYLDSMYAYQGYGLGRDLAELRTIGMAATAGLLPDITIYLELSAKEGLERKQRKRQESRVKGELDVAALSGADRREELSAPTPQTRSELRDSTVEWNRLDARELSYHQRVEQGYQALIAQDADRWQIFDARLPVQALVEQIVLTLEPWLEHIHTLEPSP